MLKMFKSFGNKALYEVDSTLYLFVLGLALGSLIFFSIKALWVLVLYIIFILSILFHDFIQISIASHYDLNLKKLVIYPFGTKKMYGEDFDSPKHEFMYAFAGLLVYLFIMLFTYFVTIIFFNSYWPAEVVLQKTITAQTFDSILISYPVFSIFWVNFLLFLFNSFILAAPLDGGRLLRSILTFIFGAHSANKFVPIISQVMAFIIMAVGIFYWDIIIIVIGGFVYFVSSKELKESEILYALSDKNVNDFVKPVELKFKTETKLIDCFDKMREELVPVGIVEYGDGRYGVIDAEKISTVSKTFWVSKDVGDVAEEIDPATDKEMLGFIAQYMVEKNLSILPVVHSRTKVLIGIIKRSDLADFLKIHKIYG